MTTPRDALRALEQIKSILGPAVPKCCQGGQAEITYALQMLNVIRNGLLNASEQLAELRESNRALIAAVREQGEIQGRELSALRDTNQQLAEKCLRLVAENDSLRARTADQITNRGN